MAESIVAEDGLRTESVVPARAEDRLPAFPYRAYVLFVSVLVGACSTLDRQILTMLVEPIRKEFQLSDQQVGLLTGLAFALVYVLAAIPAARLADRWSRRGVVALAVSAWSFMTVVCGFAQSFVQLFLARVGVGLGEAGGSAPIQALISDYFPQKQRGTALSIYLLGSPIGMGVGLAFGGWALAEYGWRWAFILAGIPGLIIGPLVYFTIREVRAGLADGVKQTFAQPPFGETIRTLWRIRTLPLMMLAATVQALIGMGMHAWIPAFIERSHGLGSVEIGAKLGAFVATGSILGHICGGPLADILGRRDIRWHLWTPVIAGLLAVCAAALAFTGPVDYAFPLLGIQVFLTGLFAAPMIYICTTLAPVWARATSAACSMFIINLIGLGLGPVAIGKLSDLLRPSYGDESLRMALLCSLVVVIPAALCFLLASRTYKADFEAARIRLGEASLPAMRH
ncbi:spinster family MFS transporter [Sphingomonas cavernae]|uniref:MFS transporter n=1 Tax=Sphingomonas cavernae TaxID=2320861 RepID=A0A418WMI8_9SPHN|nr:MFS transporter [Sphingomonas cavernae]RJF91216.1 MFS transporter [Sphingomonas cavernae]